MDQLVDRSTNGTPEDFPKLDKARIFQIRPPSEFSERESIQSSQINNKQFHNFKKLQTLDDQKDYRESIDIDFGIRPKNRVEGVTEAAQQTFDKYKFCKLHRQTPIAFYCNISKDFYCKLCVGPRHHGHDGDLPLTTL